MKIKLIVKGQQHVIYVSDWRDEFALQQELQVLIDQAYKAGFEDAMERAVANIDHRDLLNWGESDYDEE